MTGEELNEHIFFRDKWRCQHCGGSAFKYGTPQKAHRIPDTKPNRKKYGRRVLGHPLNLALTCCTSPCNSGMLVNPETEPGKILLAKIQEALDNENKEGTEK